MAAPGIIRARGPYASWIKEYSSDAFLELPASKEALLDNLSASVPYGNTIFAEKFLLETCHYCVAVRFKPACLVLDATCKWPSGAIWEELHVVH